MSRPPHRQTEINFYNKSEQPPQILSLTASNNSNIEQRIEPPFTLRHLPQHESTTFSASIDSTLRPVLRPSANATSGDSN